MSTPGEEPLRGHYDAVVVGARCAGAATAMLLARRGLRVLLLDRDRRGADTLSTLALMRAGVLQLHRWGLLEAVRDAGTPALRRTDFIYGDEVIRVPIKPRDGVDALFAPRRTLLDPLLADAAAAAGADVRYGPRLVDLQREESGRVTGVVIEDRERALHTIQSEIVIGADGLRSAVARLANAATYRQGEHACAVVYAFWRGIESEATRWHYRPGVSVGVIPTNDDAACVFAAISSNRFAEELQGDLEAGYRRQVALCVEPLARQIAGVEPVERFRGFPGQVGLLRESHGPGWALVGDAGYFKDPITAHGITDALRDAELLARAVEQGTDRALAAYQATRDELSGELFEITDAIAAFDWDLDTIRSLHLRLSRAMNVEVDALLALEPLPVRAAESPDPPVRPRQ